MDRIEYYKSIIKQVLDKYTRIRYSHGDFSNYPVYDDIHLRYIIISVGWDGYKRVHGCLLHIDIIEDKIWIQRDGTEHGIADDFLEFGLKPQEIVLGFHEEYIRPHTGFAIK